MRIPGSSFTAKNHEKYPTLIFTTLYVKRDRIGLVGYKSPYFSLTPTNRICFSEWLEKLDREADQEESSTFLSPISQGYPCEPQVTLTR